MATVPDIANTDRVISVTAAAGQASFAITWPVIADSLALAVNDLVVTIDMALIDPSLYTFSGSAISGVSGMWNGGNLILNTALSGGQKVIVYSKRNPRRTGHFLEGKSLPMTELDKLQDDFAIQLRDVQFTTKRALTISVTDYLNGVDPSTSVATVIQAAADAIGAAAAAGSDITTRPVLAVTAAPPGGPTVGDRHLVAHVGTSGVFVGHEDMIAQWNGAAWIYSSAPLPGQQVLVRSDFIVRQWNATAGWQLLYGSAAAAGTEANVITMDAACAAAGVPWRLNKSFSLTANRVFAARVIGDGSGFITRGAFTLSGSFWAPPTVQMFEAAGTGAITYTGRHRTVHLGWYGPAGDLATDDTLPLQAFVKDVCNGGIKGFFNYITAKITAALTIPNAASYYELDGGGALIRQATDNTPIFNLVLTVGNAQATNWSIHNFQLHWANSQSSANTRAIGIAFTSTAAGPGWFSFNIHHISMPLYGYMVIGRDPNSTNLNLQWQGTIEDIDCGGGVTGGVIDFITGNTGGSPVLLIRRVFHYAQAATKPTIGLYAYESVLIEGVERNLHSGAQPLIRIESSTCVKITNCKVEGETYTANTTLILVNNTLNTTIDGFDLVTPTMAVGKTLIIAKNGGLNIADAPQVILRDFTCLNDFSAFLGTLYVMDTDGNPMVLGRYQAAGATMATCPAGVLNLLRFENEYWVGAVVSGVQAIAPTSGIASATVPRKCILTKATLRLQGITGGSINVEVRKNLVSIAGGAFNATIAADGVAEINMNAINGPTGASNICAAGDILTFFVGASNTLTGTVLGAASFACVRTV